MVYAVVGVFVAFVLAAVVFGRRQGRDGNYSSDNGTWDAGSDSGAGHHGTHGCSGGGDSSCSGGSSCGGGCSGGGGD
jgi:hypothetical protein